MAEGSGMRMVLHQRWKEEKPKLNVPKPKPKKKMSIDEDVNIKSNKTKWA